MKLHIFLLTFLGAWATETVDIGDVVSQVRLIKGGFSAEHIECIQRYQNTPEELIRFVLQLQISSQRPQKLSMATLKRIVHKVETFPFRTTLALPKELGGMYIDLKAMSWKDVLSLIVSLTHLQRHERESLSDVIIIGCKEYQLERDMPPEWYCAQLRSMAQILISDGESSICHPYIYGTINIKDAVPRIVIDKER